MIEKTLLLWGDTQVGKTALLTMALFSEEKEDFGVIDREASSDDLCTTLLPVYKRMKSNSWVLPTTEDNIDIDLTTYNKNRLRIRDIKGYNIRRVDKGEIREYVKKADGILFVIEWKSKDINNQMLAIEGSWDLVEKKPHGLVFTKCERDFPAEDKRWDGQPNDWWKSDTQLLNYKILDRFGEAVWPTSAFGYSLETGFPAIIIGEFGQMIPYWPNPKGVSKPFAWIIKKIGIV
jgi:hypothetical protein